MKNHKCEGLIREKTPINSPVAPKKRVLQGDRGRWSLPRLSVRQWKTPWGCGWSSRTTASSPRRRDWRASAGAGSSSAPSFPPSPTSPPTSSAPSPSTSPAPMASFSPYAFRSPLVSSFSHHQESNRFPFGVCTFLRSLLTLFFFWLFLVLLLGIS